MAKQKNAACASCGTAVWPNTRSSGPSLCMACRYPNARRTEAPVWRLQDAAGRTTGLVLEACPVCGVLPSVTASHPADPTSPRAVAWTHLDTCDNATQLDRAKEAPK